MKMTMKMMGIGVGAAAGASTIADATNCHTEPIVYVVPAGTVYLLGQRALSPRS